MPVVEEAAKVCDQFDGSKCIGSRNACVLGVNEDRYMRAVRVRACAAWRAPARRVDRERSRDGLPFVDRLPPHPPLRARPCIDRPVGGHADKHEPERRYAVVRVGRGSRLAATQYRRLPATQSKEGPPVHSSRGVFLRFVLLLLARD